MADASDDLGIPMKPVPPGRSGSQCSGQGPPTMPPRATGSGARGRGDSRSGGAAPTRRFGYSAEAQRSRRPQADRRPRDHALGRDHLLRQADRRGQRRGQPDQLPRCRYRRERSVQGFRVDRGSRDPRPLRRQSRRPQAALDQGERTRLRDDSLRPDRDRVRRPDLGRHPGPAASRAGRGHGGRGDRPRGEADPRFLRRLRRAASAAARWAGDQPKPPARRRRRVPRSARPARSWRHSDRDRRRRNPDIPAVRALHTYRPCRISQ